MSGNPLRKTRDRVAATQKNENFFSPSHGVDARQLSTCRYDRCHIMLLLDRAPYDSARGLWRSLAQRMGAIWDSVRATGEARRFYYSKMNVNSCLTLFLPNHLLVLTASLSTMSAALEYPIRASSQISVPNSCARLTRIFDLFGVPRLVVDVALFNVTSCRLTTGAGERELRA